MKKIVASVGLIALGASCVQVSADEPYASADSRKLWNVSASLRGFYDDNINTRPSGSGKVGSFGVAITPGFGLNWEREQTTLKFDYHYSLLYYDKIPGGNTQHYDQDHTFNASLDHAFSERYQIKATDSFVVGQEPDALRSGEAITASSRTPGNNIRNAAGLIFNAQVTPVFGLEAGYDNAFFDYHQSGAVTNGAGGIIPSFSGTSDRMEQTFHLDGRWQMLPQTIGIVGYQYGMVDFTGDELIGYQSSPFLVGTNVVVLPDPSKPLFSKSRNSRSHYGYVGVDQTFNPDLQGSVRVGVRSTDYYNDPSGRNDLSPYVRLGLVYSYAPESSLQAGFSYDRNATDATSFGVNETLAQQSATVYATLTHRILPNLFGSATAQYQDSTFIGGSLDGGTEQYFLLGLNLEYKFSRYLGAELGYNYDKVSSDAGGRSYTRNKVYVGITGSY